MPMWCVAGGHESCRVTHRGACHALQSMCHRPPPLLSCGRGAHQRRHRSRNLAPALAQLPLRNRLWQVELAHQQLHIRLHQLHLVQAGLAAGGARGGGRGVWGGFLEGYRQRTSGATLARGGTCRCCAAAVPDTLLRAADDTMPPPSLSNARPRAISPALQLAIQATCCRHMARPRHKHCSTCVYPLPRPPSLSPRFSFII